VNIGDITLTPVILAWDAGDFHWNVAMSVIAPSGEYQKGALSTHCVSTAWNPGAGAWGFSCLRLRLHFFSDRHAWASGTALWAMV